MTRYLLLALSLLSLLPAASSACLMSDSEKTQLFNAFDSDHNGSLSQAEYNAGETSRIIRDITQEEKDTIAARFPTMDADKTGLVTLAELDPVSLQKCM